MADGPITPSARPRHVAIIMDGNGRWAQARGQQRIFGHEAGAESVRAITRHAAKLGLEQLTLFAFSTENWRRPRAEVDFLFSLLEHYLAQELDELMATGIRLRGIGRLEGLPAGVRAVLAETEARTRDNPGMTLCLALNYGGRGELADAAARLAADATAGLIDLAALDSDEVEDALAARVYQPDMPPLDLLIRTAGEHRLSNFLLWQVAYAELYLVEAMWPEFREEDLDAALSEFSRRVRRFGGLVKG